VPHCLTTLEAVMNLLPVKLKLDSNFY
jgi:hypothetical protein